MKNPNYADTLRSSEFSLQGALIPSAQTFDTRADAERHALANFTTTKYIADTPDGMGKFIHLTAVPNEYRLEAIETYPVWNADEDRLEFYPVR